MAELVEVDIYHDRVSADLARSILVGAGIRAHVMADDAGAFRPDLSVAVPIRLMVAADKASAAQEILSEHLAAILEEDETPDLEGVQEELDVYRAFHSHYRVATALMIFSLFIPVLPNIVSLVFLGLAIAKSQGTWRAYPLRCATLMLINSLVLVGASFVVLELLR